MVWILCHRKRMELLKHLDGMSWSKSLRLILYLRASAVVSKKKRRAYFEIFDTPGKSVINEFVIFVKKIKQNECDKFQSVSS